MCKKVSDNARFVLPSKAAFQQIIDAHSGMGSWYSTSSPLSVRKSADVFVCQARAFDDGQMGKRLGSFLGCGQQAHHQALTVHTRNPSYTGLLQEQRQSVYR